MKDSICTPNRQPLNSIILTHKIQNAKQQTMSQTDNLENLKSEVFHSVETFSDVFQSQNQFRIVRNEEFYSVNKRSGQTSKILNEFQKEISDNYQVNGRDSSKMYPLQYKSILEEDVDQSYFFQKKSQRSKTHSSQKQEPILNQQELKIPFLKKTSENGSFPKINKSKQKYKTIQSITKLSRHKPNDKHNQGWSWDTSGALIRLIQRNKLTQIIMNIYFMILMLLRTFYVFLIISFVVDRQEQLKNFGFFWVILIVQFVIRIMFSAVVIKILLLKYDLTNDLKIKIVYKIYQQTYESIKNKVHYPKVVMVVVPPEISFILFISTGLKKVNKNGYYAVQNMIMKSLDVFFFFPFLIYFLHFYDFTGYVSPFRQVYNIQKMTYIAIIIDLITFISLTIYLLVNNQKKKKEGRII